MPNIPDDASEYESLFEGDFPADSRRAKALDIALDVRKFEIGLYWRRATYFWTLIAAALAGYFALQSSDADEELVFLVGCIGLLLSLAWYLVNRGSKYWQENWERHVDHLESSTVGPLFERTISHKGYLWLKFWAGYPYSVSRINQLISLFVTIVWLVLTIGAFPDLPYRGYLWGHASWLFAFLTLGVGIALLCQVSRSRD